jgi:hypothetical protein
MVRHDIEADDLEKFEANTPEDPAPRAVEPHAVTEATVAAVAIQTSLTTAPSSGKRQSFRNIARQLDEKELCHPGTVKLIVENLEHADAEWDDLRTFVERFHDADKTSAVLQEKLKTEKAVEIAFGVGVGIGCSMISIGICVWEKGYLGVLLSIFGAICVCLSTAISTACRLPSSRPARATCSCPTRCGRTASSAGPAWRRICRYTRGCHTRNTCSTRVGRCRRKCSERSRASSTPIWRSEVMDVVFAFLLIRELSDGNRY